MWLAIARGIKRFTGGEEEFPGLGVLHRTPKACGFPAHGRPPQRRLRYRPSNSTGPQPTIRRQRCSRISQPARPRHSFAASLPDDQAEVVLFRVIGGLDVEQVAKMLGKRPGTVRVCENSRVTPIARDTCERGCNTMTRSDDPFDDMTSFPSAHDADRLFAEDTTPEGLPGEGHTLARLLANMRVTDSAADADAEQRIVATLAAEIRHTPRRTARAGASPAPRSNLREGDRRRARRTSREWRRGGSSHDRIASQRRSGRNLESALPRRHLGA